MLDNYMSPNDKLYLNKSSDCCKRDICKINSIKSTLYLHELFGKLLISTTSSKAEKNFKY